MQRASRDDGGLGTQLVGDRIHINRRVCTVSKLLGEGGFSYVYLVKDISDGSASATATQSTQDTAAVTARTSGASNGSSGRSNSTGGSNLMVLKVTSIHSRQQRDIAEKEAKLLSRLSHPSIIKMYDSCYRSTPAAMGVVASIVGSSKEKDSPSNSGKERPQHLILMEFCEGGHALDVCTKLANAGQRFDLSALIIAFGQICNAVSYLHAQRPPIVHRDLKPVNFLVKNGAYKLCDFGSAVFGHIELKTQRARMEAEEVIQKTTTQMFRAPEMVDLYMAKKLTQSTDVWALGCCLYSLAFLQNCFEEGSNLAILSRNYKIPEDNPYGEGLVELIDRMLTVDCKVRADMTEVILCLSAIYSGRPLPPRKKSPKTKKEQGDGNESNGEGEKPRGAFRTDGQGIRNTPKPIETKKPAEAKKLNPNSAAARRRRAAAESPRDHNTLAVSAILPPTPTNDEPIDADFAFTEAFGVEHPFAGLKGTSLERPAQPRDFRFENASGNSTSNADGLFSFDDGGWTKPCPEDLLDTSFPQFTSPPIPRTSRSNSGSEISVENLNLSHSDSNSEQKERKSRRRRSSKSRPKERRSGEEKPKGRTGCKGFFSPNIASEPL